MEALKIAQICNSILSRIVVTDRSVSEINSLAKELHIPANQLRRYVKWILLAKPEWFSEVYHSFFRTSAIQLNRKNINEIRYFLSQEGFCDSPLFLSLIRARA